MTGILDTVGSGTTVVNVASTSEKVVRKAEKRVQKFLDKIIMDPRWIKIDVLK